MSLAWMRRTCHASEKMWRECPIDGPPLWRSPWRRGRGSRSGEPLLQPTSGLRSAAAWTELYTQNVGPMVRRIHRLVPAMKGLKWGRVIQIASAAAPEPGPEMPAYSSTKAANVNMTVSLAKALAGTGVTANTVSPGPVVTAGFQDVFTKVAAAQGLPTDWPAVERMALGISPVPVGRLGLPDDIAHAVTYLASPRADFINGANPRVDGGAVKSGN